MRCRFLSHFRLPNVAMNPQFPDALRETWIGPVTGVQRPRAAGNEPDAGDLAARLREVQDRFARAEFDQARVDAIRKALNEGRLVIDPRAIADRMLESVVPSHRKN